MWGKIIALVFLFISQSNSQLPNCGQVQIPQMVPQQYYNWYTWTLPGSIAASNCYTGYLAGVQQALTDLYTGAYTANAIQGAMRPANNLQQASQSPITLMPGQQTGLPGQQMGFPGQQQMGLPGGRQQGGQQQAARPQGGLQQTVQQQASRPQNAVQG